ncbi:MAG: HD domain-containing protein [Alphaproteobacteria bacterium]
MTAPWTPDTYIAALHFAAKAHLGQLIPGTDIPYIAHPAQVAQEVMAVIGAESVAAPDLAVQCALLHDVVEDCNITVEALEDKFGRAVATGVAALTKDESLSLEEAMRDSLARIRQEPREVWMVKLADRISNLMPPPAHWSKQKCAAYREEAGLILEALGEASPLLAQRLGEKIEAYTQYTV